MKTSKYIAIGLFFTLGSGVSLHAQDTIINRNVSVEREYRPVIQDAGKINSVPKVLEPTVEKATAKFSDFNLPLDAGFNIHKLSAAELANKKDINKQGYARVGIGSFKNTLLDFAYPVINQSDIRLDFSVNHLGTFESKRRHTATKTALSFDKLFSTFNLYAGLGGGREYLKYYGDYFNGADSLVSLNKLISKYGSPSAYVEKDNYGYLTFFPTNTLSNNSADNTFWRFNAKVGVRSLPMSTDLIYQAEVQYQSLNSAHGISEKLAHTVAGFSLPSGQNRLGVDFELYNMMYTKANIPDPDSLQSHSVMKLNPYYLIDRPEYTLRLGFKSSLLFQYGKIYIYPSFDINAEWKAIPKQLSLYGGVGGNYEVNTLNKILTENPYIYSDLRPHDTEINVNLFAGIKLKPLYNLLLDAYVDYKRLIDQYFYVNKIYVLYGSFTPVSPSDKTVYSNRFDVFYSNASHTKLGFRASYDLQSKANVELKWAYNVWDLRYGAQYASYMPKYEAQLNASYRVNNEFSLSANLFYEGSRYAKLGEITDRMLNSTVYIPMKDKVDLNLGVSYTYLSWFTAFAKINNVLNIHYQDYYGYDVQGANVMVGAAFSF